MVIILPIAFLMKREYLKSKKGKKSKNMENAPNDKFLTSVKVGPKGQITIPKEARDMFDIKEGETLIVLGDKQRGIAIMKADAFYAVAEEKIK